MLRLSISLPNNAQINLESEDETVIDKILGIVLVDVTRALLEMPPAGGSGVQVAPSVLEPVRPVPSVPRESRQPETPRAPEPEQPGERVSQQPEQVNNQPATPQPEPTDEPTVLTDYGQASLTPESPEVDSPPMETPSAQPLMNDWAPFEGFHVEEHKAASDGANGMPSPGGRHISPGNLTPAVSEQAFIEFCRAANPLGDMRRVVVAAEGASRYLAMDGVDAEALGRLFDVVGWPRAHNFVQTLRNAARSKFGWLERIPGRSGHYTVTDLGRSTALGR